jgi:hypothetical protein
VHCKRHVKTGFTKKWSQQKLYQPGLGALLQRLCEPAKKLLARREGMY